MLDFRNLNTLWASTLVETLHRCGLTTTIVCPGSRSAPLAVAFAHHPHIEAIPILDERSASFFALGLAKRTYQPVAIVCTSGTAAANFYPAVIEARESRISLLVLTADRPPELRDCNSGQTIDQQKLFGNYVNHYSELATPAIDRLDYLRQTIVQAYQQSLCPHSGVVHLNIPLRDPLAPVSQAHITALASEFPENFFRHLSNQSPFVNSSWEMPIEWFNQKGIIIAGVAAPKDPERYVSAIANLSQTLGYPVLAEGLSPLRNFASLQPNLVTTYDTILRNPDFAKSLTPEIVIRISEMPTSKVLREWLAKTKPKTWIISESSRSIDPIHGRSVQIFGSIEDCILKPNLVSAERPPNPQYWGDKSSQSPTALGDLGDHLKAWSIAEAKIRTTIDQTLQAQTQHLESKVAWLLSQILPQNSPIYISNSMPVRDVESFWKPNDRHIRPFFNRGANGIDGTLSTALGVAHDGQPTVLLTGDLALLHDTNGFLIRKYLRGSLTIVLINNNGGGIFGMLPIAQFDPPFEEFFSTPQDIDFANLCKTYEIEYEMIYSWQQFEQRLSKLPEAGIRLLEIRTDRQQDAIWRKQFFSRTQ